MIPAAPISRRAASDHTLRYEHYAPPGIVRTDFVLVAVHGISRNAREHARALATLARRMNCHLIAPRFDRGQFSDYQRLGIGGRGRRADLALQLMLADLTRFGVQADASLILSGYSGGAQFVHRYAMLWPQRICSLLVAAAGWYTMPDPATSFPYGCADLAQGSRAPDLDAFLRIPTLAVVGAEDRLRDEALRCNDQLDAEQGLTRLARAERWIASCMAESWRRGLQTTHRFEVVGGVGHEFAAMVDAGLVERFGEFLARPEAWRCEPQRFSVAG
jgi:pimeloyl-ACP methyl ester carboxylesterase